MELPVYIFLSYSTKDKSFASNYKMSLDFYGFDVFLAHQDLVPSIKWQDSILNNLKKCDVFIPLISKNFKQSDWTDQESGIAFSFDKIILPIRFPQNPYGFLSRYQGLKGDRSLPDYLAEQTIKALSDYGILKNRLRDNLIQSFGIGVDQFKAQLLINAFIHLSPFTTLQIDSFLTHFLGRKELLKTKLPDYVGLFLVTPNREIISPEILDRFAKRTNWKIKY